MKSWVDHPHPLDALRHYLSTYHSFRHRLNRQPIAHLHQGQPECCRYKNLHAHIGLHSAFHTTYIIMPPFTIALPENRHTPKLFLLLTLAHALL